MATAVCAKLKYIPLDESTSLQPMIVNFTNGTLNEKVPHGEEGIKFKCYKCSDGQQRRHRKTLFAETDRMVYVGHNFGQFAKSSSQCKYLVGVYNGKKEEMKIYDAQMFTMQPQHLDLGIEDSSNYEGGFKELTLDTLIDEKEKNENSEKAQLSFMEKNDKLIDAFGSSKKKRAMISRQRNQVAALDDSITEALQGMLASPQGETNGTQEEEVQGLAIPPFNVEAQIASEVYSLDDIISKDDYESLHRPAKELECADLVKIETWRKEKRFPEYVLQHLATMPLSSAERHHRSCCLLYMSYMMALFQLGYRELRKKDPLPQWIPESIRETLLAVFTQKKDRNYRCVPKRFRDKQLSYILVLALIIDEFSVDVLTVTQDLKLHLNRVMKHFRFLGCKIASSRPTPSKKRKLDEDSDAGTKTAILSVPLPKDFPNHSC